MSDIEYVKVTNIPQWKISSDSGIETRTFPSDTFSEERWVFLTDNEQKLWDKIFSNILPLNDDQIAEPFTGVQSSNDSVYVIREWKQKGKYIEFTDMNGVKREIEKTILKPYLLRGNRGFTTFKSFETKKADGWIIFPYVVKDAKSEIISKSELKSKFPKAWKYLNSFKQELSTRDLRGNSTDWYRFGRGSAPTAESPKIIAGVLFKEERYIYDTNKIYFQTGDTAGYVGIKIREKSPYSIFYILGILNHIVLEWTASKMASTFEGNYIAHGQTLLRDLPIKKINFKDKKEKKQHDEIVKLVKDLINLHKNLKQAKTPRNEQKILNDISSKRTTLEKTINALYDIQSLIKYAEINETKKYND
ncbi:MAG: hypothetical protein IIA83_00045 [Thaumarchaeota archaeon]|nr:hypothetical protein [Nitrososphaerota archaeon]